MANSGGPSAGNESGLLAASRNLATTGFMGTRFIVNATKKPGGLTEAGSLEILDPPPHPMPNPRARLSGRAGEAPAPPLPRVSREFCAVQRAAAPSPGLHSVLGERSESADVHRDSDEQDMCISDDPIK